MNNPTLDSTTKTVPMMMMATTSTWQHLPCPRTTPAKPCLKLARRCSLNSQSSTESTISKNDSLDDVCSAAGSSSYSYAGSLDSSMSDCESLSSRKSVSFADSIGEDLCHIKIFCKELCEYDLDADEFDVDEQESWNTKMWRWQMFPTEESDWYLGGDDYRDDEFDLTDLTVGSNNNGSDLEDVQEEDEDEEEDESADEDDEIIYMPIARSTTTTITDANRVIVPTFLCPVDLPSYNERLSEKGVSLESVSVTEQCLISGTVRLSSTSKASTVTIRHSSDGWATSEVLPTTSFGGENDVRFGFVIDAKSMKVGDDLEIVAVSSSGKEEEESVDDNRGLKYRFICKNKPKFQPGKSLW